MPPRIPFKMSPILCIDLFTMLDAKPISKALAAQLPSGTLPDKIHSIADKWRMLQAQYTWRLNSMEHYMPFNQLIPLALQDALAEHSILTKMTENEVAALTSAYLELPVSPDVRPFLTSLSDDKSLHHKFARHTYVHANAPLSVMDALITANSGTLGVFFDSPKYIKSVDTTVKKFKPHKDAYVDFALSAGVQDKDCVLITSHSWDVVGAKRAGWRTVWVDRGGEGWCDGLGTGMGIHPDWTIKSLQDMGNVFSVM